MVGCGHNNLKVGRKRRRMLALDLGERVLSILLVEEFHKTGQIAVSKALPNGWTI